MKGAPIRFLTLAVMAAATLFLIAPLIVIATVSLSPSPVFDLPTGGASLRWYGAVTSLDGFWPALALSLEIAIFSTAISLVVGTLAGIAIARAAIPGAQVLSAGLTSPLMMPGLVLGIALLQYFRALGLTQTWPELLLAHIVVTLPFVARTMIAGLSRFDFTLLDAARTLGCGFAASIYRVMVPALAPAYLTAALFSFLASMDNYPVSIFLTDARSKTLPIKMLQYIEESPDPSIAALSTLILIATLALLFIADRAIGLHRLAGLAE
jgi:ABC-type spermidine/putrescine transport system permease subunit II